MIAGLLGWCLINRRKQLNLIRRNNDEEYITVTGTKMRKRKLSKSRKIPRTCEDLAFARFVLIYIIYIAREQSRRRGSIIVHIRKREGERRGGKSERKAIDINIHVRWTFTMNFNMFHGYWTDSARPVPRVPDTRFRSDLIKPVLLNDAVYRPSLIN